jgi:hypothetical protein
MKRIGITAAALLGALAILLPASAGAAAGRPRRAALTQFVCQKALDPSNRSVSVISVMRPLDGTRKLEVRFDLLEMTAGEMTPTAVVGAGDLGVWLTPKDPTLGQLPGDVWQLAKPVYDLNAPASYRFRVTFRWLGDYGKVIGSAVRTSPSCKQRELRPDLQVQSVSIAPITGRPRKNLYTAVIANAGVTGAGPFQVLFTPGDGSAPVAKTVQYLSGGATQTLLFVGPVCDPANPPTVLADSTAQIDDLNRSNNQLTVTCPTPAPAPAVTPARTRRRRA